MLSTVLGYPPRSRRLRYARLSFAGVFWMGYFAGCIAPVAGFLAGRYL
jgi:hypothetical protein